MSSIYSQGLAALALASKEPGCEPSPSAKSIRSAVPSSKNTGPTSPATATSEPSQGGVYEQTAFPWMSSAEAFPARTSVLRERTPALKVNAAAYGRNTPELLARLDPATSSWRTSQHSLEGGLTEFSETWPRSGTMLNGIAYQLPPLVRLTDATVSGSWPTRTGDDAGNVTRKSGDFQSLTRAVMWPTPLTVRANDSDNTAGRYYPNKKQFDLAKAVHLWRSPNASDAKGRSGPNCLAFKVGNVNKLADQVDGSLNPTWVEWLMGFPLGWTVCEAWETRSSRKSRKSSDAP